MTRDLTPAFKRTDPLVGRGCPICDGGWPRWVSSEDGRAHHELLEPAGSFRCFVGVEDDPGRALRRSRQQLTEDDVRAIVCEELAKHGLVKPEDTP